MERWNVPNSGMGSKCKGQWQEEAHVLPGCQGQGSLAEVSVGRQSHGGRPGLGTQAAEPLRCQLGPWDHVQAQALTQQG